MNDPDITSSLPSQSGAGESTPLVVRLLAAQRQSWQDGEPIPIEALLARHPELADNANAILDLIAHELVLRQECAEKPTLEEYVQRFPKWAAQIKIQFEVERAIESDAFDDDTMRLQDAPAARTLRGTADSAPFDKTLPTIPGFQLLEELGRGGQSVVYKARQESLNRIVALKLVHGGAAADPEERARVRREAEAVARLEHPQIVQIYDVGEWAGQPYLALEYIAGGTLSKKLAGTPQPARQAAEWIAGLARTIHWAHEQGIVHRDLKPSNVLLTADGTPKITDFGLARTLHADSSLTPTGLILGTPSYMAPEQASGKSKSVGPGADIYALGAILYEMLTGRPPFLGETPLDVISQVVDVDPVPPGRLQPKTPADLETICLKCLQKDPAHRYASAQALADDLQCFLDDKPITARPVGAAEQVVKWARRRPAVASLIAVIVLVTGIGFGLVTWQWREAVWQSTRAEGETGRAKRAYKMLAEEADRTEQTLAEMYTFRGLTAHERGDPGEAFLWFAVCARKERADAALANRLRFRSWSRLLHVPLRALPHDHEVTHLAFHPGGKYLLTTMVWVHEKKRENQLTIWDLDGERAYAWPGTTQDVVAAAWTPKGDRLVAGTPSGRVEIRTFPAGVLERTLDHGGDLHSIAISADGRWLALGGISARVWDLADGAYATPPLVHPGVVLTTSFSSAGDRLVTSCTDRKARRFRVPGGEPVGGETRHQAWDSRYPAPPMAPVFVHQGREFLTVLDNATAAWWDADTGALIGSKPFADAVREIPFHTPGSSPLILAMAANPQQTRLVIAGHSGARIWDVDRAEQIDVELKHINYVTALAISPNGETFLTASEDRTVRLWSLDDGRPLGPYLRHQASLRLAAFSPDGTRFATAQVDGLVRVWAVPRGHPRDHRMAIGGAPTNARISRSGRFVLPTGAGYQSEVIGSLRHAQVFDIVTGKAAGKRLNIGGLLVNAALNPEFPQAMTLCALGTIREKRDEKEVMPLGTAGHAQLWNWQTGEPLFEPIRMPSEPLGVNFSIDGKRVAVICRGGQIVVTDTTNGTVVQRMKHGAFDGENVWPAVRFTPDDRGLITWGSDNIVIVWDLATGQERFRMEHNKAICYEAGPSNDGRYLVTSGWDDTARVWDLATGKSLAVLEHPDWVFSAWFNKNADTVLTACRDGNVRIWNWHKGKGELAYPPCRHKDAVFTAAYSHDERFLISACRDGTVRMWEKTKARQIAPPFVLRLGQWNWGWTAPEDRHVHAWNARVTPDGAYAVVGGTVPFMYALHLGDLAAADSELGPGDLPLENPEQIGELLSGYRVVDDRDVEILTTKDWLKLWQQFRDIHPNFGK
ncbi:MAG: protein kinase [Planctomycetes bacterium]|nr:protein kinase [Planctomycetota bacterium]